MKFWDVSAVLPLCMKEPQTSRLKAIAEEDEELIVWWATPVECQSAFARLRHEKIFDTAAEHQARRILAALCAVWTEVEPSADVREKAGRALLLHPLRAAHSLQLAAALVWAGSRITGHHLVCLDQRLREAAQREGFTVLPE